MATSVEIWPDNVRAFNVFQGLRTQWRVGMGGATGLDFLVVYRRMDRLGLTPEEYDRLDEDIQVMEATALTVMHEQIEERSANSR